MKAHFNALRKNGCSVSQVNKSIKAAKAISAWLADVLRELRARSGGGTRLSEHGGHSARQGERPQASVDTAVDERRFRIETSTGCAGLAERTGLEPAEDAY